MSGGHEDNIGEEIAERIDCVRRADAVLKDMRDRDAPEELYLALGLLIDATPDRAQAALERAREYFRQLRENPLSQQGF